MTLRGLNLVMSIKLCEVSYFLCFDAQIHRECLIVWYLSMYVHTQIPNNQTFSMYLRIKTQKIRHFAQFNRHY